MRTETGLTVGVDRSVGEFLAWVESDRESAAAAFLGDSSAHARHIASTRRMSRSDADDAAAIAYLRASDDDWRRLRVHVDRPMLGTVRRFTELILLELARSNARHRTPHAPDRLDERAEGGARDELAWRPARIPSDVDSSVARAPATTDDVTHARITAKQRDSLQRIRAGETLEEIAERDGVEPRAIRDRMRRIAAGTADAGRWARWHQTIRLPRISRPQWERLTGTQRTVARLVRRRHLSRRQIAATLRISEETVKRALYEIRKSLKARE